MKKFQRWKLTVTFWSMRWELYTQQSVFKPGSKVSRPGSEVIRFGSKVTRPGLEVIRFGSEVTRPDSEVTRPGSEVIRPGSKVIRFRSEVTRPGLEVTRPGSEFTIPSLEVTRAGSEVARTADISTTNVGTKQEIVLDKNHSSIELAISPLRDIASSCYCSSSTCVGTIISMFHADQNTPSGVQWTGGRIEHGETSSCWRTGWADQFESANSKVKHWCWPAGRNKTGPSKTGINIKKIGNLVKWVAFLLRLHKRAFKPHYVFTLRKGIVLTWLKHPWLKSFLPAAVVVPMQGWTQIVL